MTDFTGALRRVESRLPLPQPARSRVILELAADLGELHRYYLAKGLSDDEARARALDHFDASDEVLSALVDVHTSSLRRGLDHLLGHAEARWARALLAVVLLGVVMGATRVALSPTFVEDAGPLLWPLVVCLAWGLATGGIVWAKLVRFDGADSAAVRRPLDRLAALVAAQVALAGLGAWLELYRAALRMGATGGREMAVHAFDWLVTGSALLSTGLAGALILAVVWFLLATRAAVIEDARAALLLTVTALDDPQEGGGR